MEENINKLMKTNPRVGRAGFELVSIIWSCETLEELEHLSRTVSSLLPRKYEQLVTLKDLKVNDGGVGLKG